MASFFIGETQIGPTNSLLTTYYYILWSSVRSRITVNVLIWIEGVWDSHFALPERGNTVSLKGRGGERER